jgi:hypothetical protein
MFCDLEFHCWRFYRVWKRQGNRPTRFEQDLKAAWKWRGGEGDPPLRQLSVDRLPQQKSSNMHSDSLSEQAAWFEAAWRILDTDAHRECIEWEWNPKEKEKCAIDAWQLLDTYYIELAILREGKVSVSNKELSWRTQLSESFDFPPNTPDDYLGEGSCWCLRLRRGRPNERSLRRALQMLGLEPKRFSFASTHAGWFAINPDTRTACILYHEKHTEEMSYSLLGEFIPQLFQILVKVSVCYKSLVYLRQIIKEGEKEKSLLDLAVQAGKLPSDIRVIESVCKELAQRQAAYLSDLKQMKDLATTLHAQELSLLELLRHPVWCEGDSSPAARALKEYIQRAIRQVSIEVGYADTVAQYSELVLESLNTLASGMNEQWNRKLNTSLFRLTVIALFGLVGAIAELFPEIPQSVGYLTRSLVLLIPFFLWGVIEIGLLVKTKISEYLLTRRAHPLGDSAARGAIEVRGASQSSERQEHLPAADTEQV